MFSLNYTYFLRTPNRELSPASSNLPPTSPKKKEKEKKKICNKSFPHPFTEMPQFPKVLAFPLSKEQ